MKNLFKNEFTWVVAHKISHDQNVLKPIFDNLSVSWSHKHDTCYDSDGSLGFKDRFNKTQGQNQQNNVIGYIKNKSNKNTKGKALFMRFVRLLDKDCKDEVIKFMNVILDKIPKDDNGYKSAFEKR